MNPFFPFEKAIEQWGRSFAKMNISYKGAKMDLDLLDRKGKYSNGFCRWPALPWIKPDGSRQPATTHFTSLADPSAVGSGLTGLTTLMHAAGHAAHFANIEMPSPLFGQERAPTCVPYAELQSMFLDALVGDAAWRAKYAISRDVQRKRFLTRSKRCLQKKQEVPETGGCVSRELSRLYTFQCTAD